MNCLNQLFKNLVKIYIKTIGSPYPPKKPCQWQKYIYQWASMICEYVVNFSQAVLGDTHQNCLHLYCWKYISVIKCLGKKIYDLNDWSRLQPSNSFQWNVYPRTLANTSWMSSHSSCILNLLSHSPAHFSLNFIQLKPTDILSAYCMCQKAEAF